MIDDYRAKAVTHSGGSGEDSHNFVTQLKIATDSKRQTVILAVGCLSSQ